MYGERKVLDRIHAITKRTGWVPTYHSFAQIDSFNRHHDTLFDYDSKGNQFQKRDYNYDERKWIENEYNICACDYRYWSDNYVLINGPQGIARYPRRISQEILVQLWAEREERGLEIRQIILKARQQGTSTEVEKAITHRVNFGLGVYAAVGSADSDAAERMSGMMQLAYNNQPLWMQAPPTADRAGSLMAFGGNSTRLTIYTGRKLGGLARGDTPTVVHLSEVSEWPNPKTLIEDSLFKAVHPSPRVFMILESTGNGNTGWWADTWYWSRDNFASGGASLQPVFFPWFLASDLFPTASFLQDHPVPSEWIKVAETERMATKCAAYVRQTPLLRQFLGDNWTLPEHQMWYWQFYYLEHKGKHNAKGWFQEMPIDDVEALQPKKDLVFDLGAVEEQSQQRLPYSCWAITGEQVMEKHHPMPSDIDYSAERFRVSYKGIVTTVEGRQSRDLVWEFVPLKPPQEEAGRLFNADLKALIFEWPEPGYDYSIGVDTANGGSGDNTVICVNRVSKTGREPDVQVAEFASNQVSSAEAHAFVLALATLYSAEMAGSAHTEPLVAVEQVRGPGDNVQLQMKMHGYRRFYKFSRMDGKNPKADKRKSKKEGWYTWSWSRDFMLDIYKHAVENGWLLLQSPFLLRHEIPAFQIDQTATGKVRYDHESGKHDDRIFASAIAYIIAHDIESMSRRVERKFVPDAQARPEINLAFPPGLAVSYEQIADGFERA